MAAASWNGILPQWLLSLHNHYSSEIIRISPNEVSLISPSTWNEVYAYHAGRPTFPKDVWLYTGARGLIVANDTDHARMRRLLSHAFSDKALKEQEPLIQAQVDELIRGFKTQCDGPKQGKVNLVDWYRWVTFDIIGDLAFGEPFDCLKTARYHSWVAVLLSMVKFIVRAGVTSLFPPLHKLLGLVFLAPRLRQAMQDHTTMSVEKVERRMEAGTSRPDFMSYILAHNEEKIGMTRKEIHYTAETFIGAGSETTSSLMVGAMYFLLLNPECLRRTKAEIRYLCKSREDINLQRVGDLKYLDAVINETFRIYPTGLAGQPCKAPPEGAVVCGHSLPGGTGIQMNQYAAFHSPLNFSEPSVFAPERWLGDPRSSSDKKDVLQPFSVGPRNCIGKNLAMAEIRLVLVRTLWEFDIGLCEETSGDWLDQKVWLTWQQKPLIVKLTPRSD